MGLQQFRRFNGRYVYYTCLCNRILDYIRNSIGNGRAHREAYCGRLLPHTTGRTMGFFSAQFDQGGTYLLDVIQCYVRAVWLTFHLQVYPAGSVHHLQRGTAKQYKMHEGCFALEYARGSLFTLKLCQRGRRNLTYAVSLGWIPLMLPFGFADSLSSTLDIPSLYDTIVITGREMTRNLWFGKI